MSTMVAGKARIEYSEEPSLLSPALTFFLLPSHPRSSFDCDGPAESVRAGKGHPRPSPTRRAYSRQDVCPGQSSTVRSATETHYALHSQRRDTLRRLIDLAHSPHTSLKVIAATNLKLFIKDFPELEDDAINAVYDLCEDPVSTVRASPHTTCSSGASRPHRSASKDMLP